jgi:hypothetical protein
VALWLPSVRDIDRVADFVSDAFDEQVKKTRYDKTGHADTIELPDILVAETVIPERIGNCHSNGEPSRDTLRVFVERLAQFVTQERLLRYDEGMVQPYQERNRAPDVPGARQREA